MIGTCHLCGCETDEWALVPVQRDGQQIEVCQECDLELQGFYDDEDTVHEEEQAELAERAELALNCRCGAWVLRDGRPLHCGDCVCGAQ